LEIASKNSRGWRLPDESCQLQSGCSKLYSLEGKHMRHRRGGSKLGKQPAHRRAVLRNLVTNVITHERITTTRARAKAARPLVERMITLGKRDTLHARRQALAFLMTPDAARKLFRDIAPRFAARNGGYTRVIPAGWRISDGAELAILELIDSRLRKRVKKEKKGEAKAPEAEKKEEKKDS
jgi:large subunit ribosomal protein L17